MEKDNKMILQSYKLTAIRNDFGIYAQRLIVRIAEQMQYRLEDADFTKAIFNPSDKRLYWEFNVKDLLIDGDNTNYTAVKRELRKVIKASVYFENEKGGWQDSVIFTDIWGDDKDGKIQVKINDTLWWLFLEFSKGFKTYQLANAMQLSSTYALRLYQLISNNAEPITYTIDWLKQMFQVQNKYKLTKDFIKKVIEPAQAEINEKCPTGFDYKIEYKANGKGRPAIHAVTFIPRKNFSTMTNEEKDKTNMGANPLNIVDRDCKRALREKYGLSEREMLNNSRLIAMAEMNMENPSLAEFLTTRLPYAQKADRPKAYIMGAIRQELKVQLEKKLGENI